MDGVLQEHRPGEHAHACELQAIDARIEREEEGEYLLKYNKGDTCAGPVSTARTTLDTQGPTALRPKADGLAITLSPISI